MSLILLAPTRGHAAISSNAAVLVTGGDGFVSAPDDEQGLFVYETRFVSAWRWSVAGATLECVLGSSIEQDRWMGYYVAPAFVGADPARDTIELVLRRTLSSDGLREEATATALSPGGVQATFELDVGGDFRDQSGTDADRSQLRGKPQRLWRELPRGTRELVVDWRAVRTKGRASTVPLHRTLRVTFEP